MRKIISIILVLVLPALSQAQSNSRAQSWDFSFGALYQLESSAGGENGSSLDVDSAIGLTLGFGYNLNDRLNISGSFDFLRPDYTAFVVTEPNPPDGSQELRQIDHELKQFNGRLKGTFYFTEGPLSPFIEAGLGWSYIDSNVADGPPQGFCWWHPWWGYICDSFVDTFDTTEFSYGGGLGVRYDMPGNSFVKASYNLWVLDTGGSRADPQLEDFRIEYGWRF